MLWPAATLLRTRRARACGRGGRRSRRLTCIHAGRGGGGRRRGPRTGCALVVVFVEKGKAPRHGIVPKKEDNSVKGFAHYSSHGVPSLVLGAVLGGFES